MLYLYICTVGAVVVGVCWCYCCWYTVVGAVVVVVMMARCIMVMHACVLACVRYLWSVVAVVNVMLLHMWVVDVVVAVVSADVTL